MNKFRIIGFAVCYLALSQTGIARPNEQQIGCQKIAQEYRSFFDLERDDVVSTREQRMGEIDRLLECLSSGNGACVVFEDENSTGVWRAKKPLRLANPLQRPMKGAAKIGVVEQLTKDRSQHICIAAQYSGGSSAYWVFSGWLVTGDSIRILPSISEYRLNADHVAPEELVSKILRYTEKDRHLNKLPY